MKGWAPVLALVAGWVAATAVVVALVIDGRSTALERGEHAVLAEWRRTAVGAGVAMGALTGGIAHDFANLLGVVSTNLHLIALGPADRDSVAQATKVANLVVNARDALAGRGRIVLRTYPAPTGEACLAVEDEGPGMSADVRRRAIEPFFTTKGEAGTGLGLAQVCGFTQQIGGSLQLESAPGKGARVHFRFPRAPDLMRIKTAS